MHFSASASALTVSLLAFATSVTAQTCPAGTRPTTRLQWQKCTGVPAAVSYLECSQITVPLDWLNPLDTRTLDIPLVRIPGTRDANGHANTIVYNPGGPGIATIANFLSGDNIQGLTGNQYHIMAFDPRGTGLTRPYTCNTNYQGNSLQDFYNNAIANEQTCLAQNPDTNLLGSAYVARDINAMFDALSDADGDGLIRYYGYSYGTLLGSTVAALFPLKLGGMVIDGNIHVENYYANYYISANEKQTAALTNFFDKCAAASADECNFRDANQDSAGLLTKWTNWVGKFNTDGSYYAGNKGLDQNTQYNIKRGLFNNLYNVYNWPYVAAHLQAFFDGREAVFVMPRGINYNPSAKFVASSSAANSTSSSTNSTSAVTKTNSTETLVKRITEPSATTYSGAFNVIQGGDSRLPAGQADPNGGANYGTIQSNINQISPYLGNTNYYNSFLKLAFNPRAKEVYDPTLFNGITTSATIMILNGNFDPITPISGARRSLSAFTNSRLLINSDGAGHCTSANPSTGLNNVVRAYWLNGATPGSQETSYLADLVNSFTGETRVTGSVSSNHIDQQADISYPPSFLSGEAFAPSKASKREVVKRQGTALPTTCLPTGVSTTSTSTATSTSTGSTSTTSGTTSASTTASTSTSAGTSTSGPASGTTTASTSGATSASTSGPASGTTTATTSTSTYTYTVGPTGVTTTYTWSSGYSTWTSGYPTWTNKASTWSTWTTAKPPKPSGWDKPYDWTDVYRVTKTLTTTWVEKCPATVVDCPWGKYTTKTSVYETWTDVPTKTVYVTGIVDVCPTGLTTSVVTITATCAQGCLAKPTGCPDGYTTTAVWCDKCAMPTTVIVTRVDPNWTPITVVPVAPASTWSAVPVAPASTWAAVPAPVAPASTWSAASVPVKPAETWAANNPVKGYTGGATSVTVSLGGLVVAIFAAALAL